MSDRKIEWALVQMIVSRTPVLPDWVRECAKIRYDAIGSLPVVDDAEEGELARPGVELRSVSSDYLEFLREQIELNARGEEWTAVLQRRLKALEPFEGQRVLTVMFHRKPKSLTLRIDPRSETILGYEEY
ncbi:hypothetical protein [Sorangium sp. So ce394]|uniref:hypothetical protein n=1 Tax=Sorangium sp. So ce394 TaxID=3133310 RepID=UPI003F5C497B